GCFCNYGKRFIIQLAVKRVFGRERFFNVIFFASKAVFRLIHPAHKGRKFASFKSFFRHFVFKLLVTSFFKMTLSKPFSDFFSIKNMTPNLQKSFFNWIPEFSSPLFLPVKGLLYHHLFLSCQAPQYTCPAFYFRTKKVSMDAHNNFYTPFLCFPDVRRQRTTLLQFFALFPFSFHSSQLILMQEKPAPFLPMF